MAPSFPKGILQVRRTSSLWSICLILLLRLTVTLGGEEQPKVVVLVSASPMSSTSSRPQPEPRVSSLRSQESHQQHQHQQTQHHVNVTKSFVHQLTSPSSPPFSSSQPPWLRVHHRDEDGNVDHSDEEEEGNLSTPPKHRGWTTMQSPLFATTPLPPPGMNNNNNASAPPAKRRTTRKQFCSKTYAYLDKCLAHIPPIPDIGIPSNPVAVDSACKTFNMGMACVDEWTSKCLAKEKIAKFKASISGAHETFTFLCKDQKFRHEFLKHGDCYKRISSQWDECSKHFIDNMKRQMAFHTENSTIQCCVRLSFLTCVSEISHYHCKKDAAQFLQRMAETLIRSTMRNHVPPQCLSIHQRNCSILSTAPSSYILHEHTFSTTIFVAVSTILSSIIFRSIFSSH